MSDHQPYTAFNFVQLLLIDEIGLVQQNDICTSYLPVVISVFGSMLRKPTSDNRSPPSDRLWTRPIANLSDQLKSERCGRAFMTFRQSTTHTTPSSIKSPISSFAQKLFAIGPTSSALPPQSAI
jgi:hypothetical protein